MSKIDQKYIDSLETFTNALEKIVEILKEQQKTNKVDVVNEFLKAPMDNLVEVVADLKKITERGFKDIKSDNQEILRKIDSIKQQKESGMFDRVEDPKNKNKIVDGIKVVILIAAGVLALGMAFKITGKVDFLSVMAISTAIMVMAVAFSKISKLEGLTLGKVLTVSGILPIIAFGILAASYFLKWIPEFTLMQGLSLVFIAGALSVTTYLLLTALNKIHIKSLFMVPLIPFILPLVALGIVMSSKILKNIQQLSLMQVLAVGLVGLALGVAVFGISLALKGLKNVTWKELLMLPISIPLIAGGIVLASLIFQRFVPIQNPVQLLISSAVIGLSMLFFAPAVLILGKMKIEDLLLGVIAILPMVWAITKASIIFDKFIPLKNPLQVGISSLAMGLSILTFAPAIWFIGKYLDLKQLTLGALGAIIVSGAILATALIFTLLPDKMKYPDFKWSLGVGLSLALFGAGAMLIGTLITGTGGIAAVGLAFGLISIIGIAATMVEVSKILNEGDYSKYPPLEWSKSVSISLVAFSTASVLALGSGIIKFLTGKDPLLSIAQSMINVAVKLNEYNWANSNYPSLQWSLGVGTALSLFAAAYSAILLIEGVGRVFTFLTGGKSQSFNDFVVSATASMATARDNLTGNWETKSYPSLQWSQGVGTALALFAAAYATILSIEGVGRVFTFFTGGGKSQSFNEFVLSASKIMGESYNILKGYDWSSTNYPKKEYSESIGSLLVAMADAYSKIANPGFLGILRKKVSFKDFAEDAATTLISMSSILSGGNFNKPLDIIWIKSLGSFIDEYANIVARIKDDKHFSKYNDTIIDIFTKLSKIPKLSEFNEKISTISNLSNSFLSLSTSIGAVNVNLESFATLINKLDATKISNVLKPIDKSSAKLEIVNKAPESRINLLTGILPESIQSASAKEENSLVNDRERQREIETQKQFYKDVSDIKSLLFQFKDHLDKPSQSGSSFHK